MLNLLAATTWLGLGLGIGLLTAYRDEGLHEGVEGVGRAAAAAAVMLLVVKVKLAAEELRGKCSECTNSGYSADEL